MKKLNLTILLTWLMSMVVTNAYAYEFVEDGIYYNWDYSSGSTGLEVTYISYDPSEGVETNYSGNIVIPSTVKYYGRDYPVTSIGDYAFYNCNDLESITIPSSVKRIGYVAFYCDNTDAPILSINISSIKDWCEITTDGIGRPYRLYLNGDMVTELNIPSGITSIKDKAFTNCCNITSIIIPEGVTSIGDYAFAFAYGGMSCSVTIPNSLVSIGYYAFTGIYCDAIYISDLSAWCNISDNYSGLQSYSYSLFLNEVEITNLIIPNDVSSIRRNAFEHCTSLTSVTIPNSVTSIGDIAFADCSSLTSITIPTSVMSIGKRAFEKCSGLTSVTIPNSVTSIGDYAFSSCSALTSATIGNGVTSIGLQAFSNCPSLTTITMPSNSISIGTSAFEYCYSLKKVIVPDIAAWCKNYFINSLSNPLHFAHHIYSDENTEITVLNIPNSITRICQYTFDGCTALTSITIPASVTDIEAGSFSECSSLTSITIPNSVINIGNSAFSGCSSLTSITIPNSVTSIGPYAFSRCSNLSSINIPNVITIGNSAFSGCSNLSSINIPNVITIGSYAFSECSSLSSINIPSLTRMGYGAFSECTGLTSITLPNSVWEIEGYAFKGVEFSYIISLIENPFMILGKNSNASVFSENTFNNATLYVPSGTFDKYKSKNGWKDFVNIVEGDPTEIKNIETDQYEEVSYFGLDGKRIESPKTGSVVIKKTGQKSVKVLVK